MRWSNVGGKMLTGKESWRKKKGKKAMGALILYKNFENRARLLAWMSQHFSLET